MHGFGDFASFLTRRSVSGCPWSCHFRWRLTRAVSTGQRGGSLSSTPMQGDKTLSYRTSLAQCRLMLGWAREGLCIRRLLLSDSANRAVAAVSCQVPCH